MSVVLENKFETIKIPVQYKNIFLKIVNNFSVKEVEEKIFIIKKDDNIISKKIREINEKEKKWQINFVSFEEGQKQWLSHLKKIFSN